MEQTQSLVRFACEADDQTAKKSNRRINRRERKGRTKFMLEGVREELYNLQRENEILRRLVQENIKPLELAESILTAAEAPPVDVYLHSSVLMDEIEESNPQSAGAQILTKDSSIREKDDLEEEKKSNKDDSIPKGIPRVLSFHRNPSRSKKSKPEISRKKPALNTFHNESVENLALALSGDFAF